MLRNFRQVFKSNRTPMAGVMMIVLLGLVAYLAPTGGQAGAPDTVVARIYGKEVQQQEVDRALSDMLRRMPRQQNLEAMMPYLQSQALNRIMSEKLTQELADRHGIVVTDDELRARLEAELKAVPAFLTPDRQLKPVDEINEMLLENGQTLAMVEHDTRLRMAAQKLETAMAVQVPVDEVWLNTEHRVRQEKLSFESVSVAPDLSAPADPGDAKLEAFLKASGTRFQVGPRRVVQYVALDAASFGDALKPSEQALRNAYEAKKAQHTELKASHILFKATTDDEVSGAFRKAQELRARLAAGLDFAATAEQLSEDPSAKANKGDLGWFRLGSMVKPFEDAALALKPGELSAPVRTNFGVHLIRLEGRREKSFEEIQDALRAQLTQEQFASKAKEKLEGLRKRTGERGDLAAAAKKAGLKAMTSQPFLDEPSAQIQDLPESFRIPAEAFRMKVGQVSKVQKVGERYVVFRVVEERPSTVPPLAEVRGQVLAGWRTEEARRSTLERAKELLASGGFAALAGTRETKDAVTVQSLGLLGQQLAIRKALLETALGQTTPCLWTADGQLWVARITARVPAEPMDFAARHALVQELQTTTAQKLVQAELQNLYADGRLRQGFSSLWGRLNGVWINEDALKAAAQRSGAAEGE